MIQAKVKPGKLHGKIAIPSSKSHTLRSLLFALMAKGRSTIAQALPSPDTLNMIEAIRQLGARIDTQDDLLLIDGVDGQLQSPENIIQCGNSGQVLRFIGALSALLPSYTILTGDHSIRHNRPLSPLIEALNQLGAFAASSRLDGYAPLIVKGPLKKGVATLDGADSQPVSGLLILGAFSPLELSVKNGGEKPWIDLTLSWFDKLGIPYENNHYSSYKMKGGSRLKGFEYTVAGDFSSAAFPLVAALLTQSELVLQNIDLNDVQGDRALIPVLQSMGASFESHGSSLHIKKINSLHGKKIDINNFIDALPILAVVGCFASGKTELVNGTIARQKESDRIHAIATELKKMGAQIEEKPDGLVIHPSPLHGHLNLQSHSDHRIAMALSVAALAAEGESLIHDVACVGKSYPTFFDDFRKIGAFMELQK